MKITFTVSAALLALAISCPASGAEPGDILFKLRGNYNLREGNPKIPVSVDQRSGDPALYNVRGANAVGAEISATYFVTKNVAAEVGIALSSYKSKESSGRELFSAGLVSPSVIIQYNPNPDGAIRPYVGIGATYINKYSEKPEELLTDSTTYPVEGYSVIARSRIAPVGQIGIDISIDDKIYLNLDGKYIRYKESFSVTQMGGRKIYGLDVDQFIVGAGVGFRF